MAIIIDTIINKNDHKKKVPLKKVTLSYQGTAVCLIAVAIYANTFSDITENVGYGLLLALTIGTAIATFWTKHKQRQAYWNFIFSPDKTMVTYRVQFNEDHYSYGFIGHAHCIVPYSDVGSWQVEKGCLKFDIAGQKIILDSANLQDVQKKELVNLFEEKIQ